MKPAKTIGNELEFPPAVKALLEFERLKETVRQSPIGCGSRQELVGEHSWHLALAVPLLASFSPLEVDVAKATLLAVVHDLAEVFVGDTFAFGDETMTQHEREHGAMDKLRDESNDPSVLAVVELWEEYEAQETPEAKFVKGLDAFLPILLNYVNLENSSWRKHEVPAAKVNKRLNRVRSSLGTLADLNDEMIRIATESGELH